MQARFYSKEYPFDEVEVMYSLLLSGQWTHLMVENYFSTKALTLPHETLPYFDNLISVVPGALLDQTTGKIIEDRYFPNFIETSRDIFLETAEQYFAQFEGKTIGVHLSGGLDSSIVICLLKYFNIPCHLVGFSSNTFEFRTERMIQEIMSAYGKTSKLFMLEDYLPYSNLKKLPLANAPDEMPTKHHHIMSKMIDEFKTLGVDVIFTGQGGDTILADTLSKDYSCNFGHEFYQGNEADYEKAGMQLVSFFADPIIVDHLISARLADGGEVDALKRWARSYFSFMLPRELAKYTYVADFFGTSLGGLVANADEIKQILQEAYHFSGLDVFTPANVKNFLNQDVFGFDYNKYIAYNQVLSLGCWYYALVREGAVRK